MNSTLSSNDLVIQDGYCRNRSRQYDDLAEMMRGFYPSDYPTNSLICPSGISAISVCLNALFQPDMIIIRSHELYCDTPRLLNSFTASKKYNKDNKTQFTDKKVIFFIESASNPSGDIFDFKILPLLRKVAKQLIVIVDNTWLSHVILNPMKYDVDIVVNSLTKYYSAGNCIAGSIVCREQYFSSIKSYMYVHGIHTSPYHCQLILDNIGNIEERIISASTTICLVANAVMKLFANVRHASIPTDPSHELAKEYYLTSMNDERPIYPSVLTFKIKISKADAIEWMKSTGLKFETSFGSAHSKFDSWPKQRGNYTLCRLSIGYASDAESVIAALKT